MIEHVATANALAIVKMPEKRGLSLSSLAFHHIREW
jgi:hypothetical protein